MFRVEYKPDKENILKAGWMLKWPWTNIKSRQISTKSPRFGIIQFRKCEFEEVFMSHYQFHSPKSQGVQTKTGLSHCIFSLAPIFGHFCVCLAWKFIWHFEMPFLYVFGIFDLFVFFLAWWCVWHFEMPFFCVFGLMVCLAFWNAFSGNLSFCRRRDCQFLHRSKMKLDAMPILFSFFSTGQDQTGWKANTFLFLFNRTRSSWM